MMDIWIVLFLSLMVLPQTCFVEHVYITTDYFYHQRLIQDVVNYFPSRVIESMVLIDEYCYAFLSGNLLFCFDFNSMRAEYCFKYFAYVKEP